MLIVAVAVLAVLAAAAGRRWSTDAGRLAVATSTLVALAGAAAAWLALAVLAPSEPPAALVVIAAAAAAAGAVLGAGRSAPWVRAHLPDPERPTLVERASGWSQRHPARLGGVALTVAAVGCVRRAVEVRVAGLAAEMTYYALISVVPLTTALGAGLGYLERFTAPDRVARLEETAVDSVSRLLADEVARDALVPLVQGLLRQERAGVAVGSVALALWLASRMFRAAVRALDDTSAVEHRRGFVAQRVLGLALAVGGVATLVVLLALVVVGPLLGTGEQIADRLGLGEAFAATWTWARWPVVAAVATGYLTLLYRYGPNLPEGTTWRDALPGAVVGTVGLVAVAAAFTVYLEVAGPTGPDVDGTGAVQVAAQVLGAVLAGALWLWLSSAVLVVGGIVNAELAGGTDGSSPVEE